MSKTKLFLTLSVLTLILIFSVAIVCGQCGTQATDEQKIDVERPQPEGEDDNTPTATASQQEPEEEQDVDGQKPTVSLSVVMGPTYSEDDDVCFYRVKAETTGDPEPDIEWSKDDSNGAWGEDITQVNLEEGESYTLIVTAVNTAGSSGDSITLEWGCDQENSAPQITLMVVPYGDVFVSSTIDLEVVAEDADGDSLAYLWDCDHGSFSDNDSSVTQWTAPDTAGEYTLTVAVSDPQGGTANIEETVTVVPMLGTALALLDTVGNETGCIASDGSAVYTSTVFIGQDTMGTPKEGYVSFDISGLAGHTLAGATLIMENPIEGNPRDAMGSLVINSVYYGPGDLNSVAVSSPNKAFLASFPHTVTSISYSGGNLTSAIQSAIDNGDPRFQIRIKWEHPDTYGAGIWHGLNYQKFNIHLTVES